MKRLGILGGTFDPPHLAHLIAAEQAVEAYSLDRLLWVPASMSPHKVGMGITSADHRLAMTRLATGTNEKFEVSEIEINRPAPSYTIDTVTTLQERYPEHSLFLFLGFDQFAAFNRWREFEKILSNCSIVVMNRPTGKPSLVEPRLLDRVQFLPIPQLEISSTDIRARVRTGKSIRYLVPESVIAYMKEHDLYRP